MDSSPEFILRGRCACGKRYRILHARAGVSVDCPHCNRPIRVSDAAIARAVAAVAPAPAPPPPHEPLREVRLVDFGELRLAPRGSRIGLTGRKVFTHEEAALNVATNMHTSYGPGEYAQAGRIRTYGEGGWSPRLERQERPFWYDLLLSFVLAMSWRNALAIAGLAGADFLLTWFVTLFPSPFAFSLYATFASALLLWVVQFYWSVLELTANGEDEIPLAPANWNWWEDAVRPALWLAAISAACSVPWLLTARLMAGRPGAAVFEYLALAAGWFLWPLAVLVIGTGASWRALRPNVLVLALRNIGAAYVLVWVLSTLVLALLWSATVRLRGIPGLSLPLLVLRLYGGYVFFRMIGLLYRHYQQRLPWRG